MKLSWPPGWGQKTQMPLQPNLTSAWTPCVSSIRSDSSRCFWGREGGTRVPDGSLEGDGLESPLWPLTSGLQEWTVIAPPSSTLSEARLWLVDLSDDLWTLSVSVMFRLFGVFDFEQQRDLQLNTNIRFISVRDKKDRWDFCVWCRGAAALWSLPWGNWCSDLTCSWRTSKKKKKKRC